MPPLDTPSLFNPTNLDASEWVAALKAAGFRQAKLVVKHTTGFCLWPSAYTDYSVKNSPWKNGQGDVVRDFTDAMHAAGMSVAFYLSPLDDHYPSSSADYETYFRNQLTELLTNYGPVYEIEFNGYQAPTALDWAGIVQLAHRLQPEVLVYTGAEIAADGRGPSVRRDPERPGLACDVVHRRRAERRPLERLVSRSKGRCPIAGSTPGSGTRTTRSSRSPTCSRSTSPRSA